MLNVECCILIEYAHIHTCTCVCTTPDRMAAIESDKCKMPNAFARLSRVMLVAVLQYSTVHTLLRKVILPRCPPSSCSRSRSRGTYEMADGGWMGTHREWMASGEAPGRKEQRNTVHAPRYIVLLIKQVSTPTNNSNNVSDSNNYHPAPLP